MSRIRVKYCVHSEASDIDERASAIAVEQSVEMPVEAIENKYVLSNILGQVENISDNSDGTFNVYISLSVETTGLEISQLVNMIFGNSSIHNTIKLEDAIFPKELIKEFGGPNQGLKGLRGLCGAKGRAMTCSALKPQGLSIEELSSLAKNFTLGGIDFIKDDHGLANQQYSPFSKRIPACAKAVRLANLKTGGKTNYIPSLSGNLDQLRNYIRIAKEEGIKTVMMAPMLVGLPSFHALVKENPDFTFFAHPSMTGASQISPVFIFGKLFRLLGADAGIFVNYGGRFSFSKLACRRIASECLNSWGKVKKTVPVPAGGMTLKRVDEILEFYGKDVMLLIGGDLLLRQNYLSEATSQFVEKIFNYPSY